MSNYQRQKRPKAALVEKAEMDLSNPGECPCRTGKDTLHVEAKQVNIMEDPEFLKEWAKYDRDLKSIPALLGDILKETLATRILLEGQ